LIANQLLAELVSCLSQSRTTGPLGPHRRTAIRAITEPCERAHSDLFRRWLTVDVVPARQFRTIKSFADLKDLLAEGDSDSVERIVRGLHLEVQAHRAAG
jgi:hypothetical protein